MAQCPLCHHDQASRLFEGRDRVRNLPGTFTIFRCHHCHALFIKPWLSDAQLSAYYPEHYGRYRASRFLGRKSYKGMRRFVLENYYGYPSANGAPPLAKRGAAFLLSFVMAKDAFPYRGDGRFLDIGCGGGSYLYRLRQWGWEPYGVEPSESGVRQARALGLDVRQGQLQGASFPDSFFDAIRLSHVLEHLVDPQGTFREMNRVLKPDGVVYVTVPNTRSLNFRLFGPNWYALDAPRHVISYSPRTLRSLCGRTGFEIIDLRFRSGPFNFVRSMGYWLEEERPFIPRWLRNLDWPHNRLIRRTLRPFFFFVDLVRWGDVMAVTLGKATRPLQGTGNSLEARRKNQ